ncbi:hypothetical protein H0H81_008882 [Sphagnurus paluster]|uniref:Uncharacterized protein n=1 Tax=Sphagnurus paluster TaxID=117069 RepID=A0A9P7GJU8_9AGAR|nr:hypothetical protein H0H81_008882 [Sphagnurus paluster]
MRLNAVVPLAFFASALAYQVTEPSTSVGWTDIGAQIGSHKYGQQRHLGLYYTIDSLCA